MGDAVVVSKQCLLWLLLLLFFCAIYFLSTGAGTYYMVLGSSAFNLWLRTLQDEVGANNNNNVTSTNPVIMAATRRILRGGAACTPRDISIAQSRDVSSVNSNYNNGIPQFRVQIVSTCTAASACSPSNIHLNCGWFASAFLVNPGIFRRLAFNDCLVNAGQPLPRGKIIRFTYRNSYMYPITFKFAHFC